MRNGKTFEEPSETPEEIVGLIVNLANRPDLREVQERQVKEIKALILKERKIQDDLVRALSIIKTMDETLAHVHGLLSEDYFEKWDQCVEAIESCHANVEAIAKGDRIGESIIERCAKVADAHRIAGMRSIYGEQIADSIRALKSND